MITLPTRKRLEHRRDALYRHLHGILQHATTQQVEDIMRRIHIINYRLLSYFQKEISNETKDTYKD